MSARSSVLPLLAAAALAGLGAGCTHTVFPNPRVTWADEARLPVRARYYLAPEDRGRVHADSYFALGYANTWRIELGQALERALPLQLQTVFTQVGPAATPDDFGDADVLLVASLGRFEVSGGSFTSTLELLVRALDSSRRVLFEERIVGAPAEGMGGTAWFGGAFAGSNALQKSAELAFEDALPKLAWRLRRLWAAPPPGPTPVPGEVQPLPPPGPAAPPGPSPEPPPGAPPVGL